MCFVAGKTETLVALIRLLVLMGKSVLITSHTHSAVDNVLQRLLKENLNFLRLGNASRIAPTLHAHCEEFLTVGCAERQDLERLYNSYVSITFTINNQQYQLYVCSSCTTCS